MKNSFFSVLLLMVLFGISVNALGQGVVIPGNLDMGDLMVNSVAVGTSVPAVYHLDVIGNARLSGAFYDSNGDAGKPGEVLSVPAGGGTDWIAIIGTATDGEVLAGKTYSNASGASTGTMVNVGAQDITPGTVAIGISQGYHNGSGEVDGDNDLAAGNIKSGVDIFGVTGTGGTWPYAMGIPKTGQTVSYATGDDGDLKKGVAWESPRFTDNSDGTVTDNNTGLIWLKDADCFGLKNWTTALSDCNNLVSGACGLSDGSAAGEWRVPNVNELFSLIDRSQYNPALPGDHLFTEVQTGNYFYLSSSTRVPNTSIMWLVSMAYGSVSSSNKTNTFYFWPVRGGQ